MPLRVFLDSNVFLFAIERPRSNSWEVVRRLVEGAFRGVVTDRVVREVMGYLRRHYDKDLASKVRDTILLTCDLVLEEELEIGGGLVMLVGRKDAGALAAVRGLGLSRLVSTDSDFAGTPEWRTPREFLRERGWRSHSGAE